MGQRLVSGASKRRAGRVNGVEADATESGAYKKTREIGEMDAKRCGALFSEKGIFLGVSYPAQLLFLHTPLSLREADARADPWSTTRDSIDACAGSTRADKPKIGGVCRRRKSSVGNGQNPVANSLLTGWRLARWQKGSPDACFEIRYGGWIEETNQRVAGVQTRI